jgi:hypothetical protein
MHALTRNKQTDVSLSMLPNQSVHKVLQLIDTVVVICLYIDCCFLNCTTQINKLGMHYHDKVDWKRIRLLDPE